MDGVFAIGGSVLAAMHVNRDLVEVAAENIKAMFGKDPLEITEDEWKQYKAEMPQVRCLPGKGSRGMRR